MSKPLISICIPAYKTPDIFLSRAINIIREQTLHNFELIIINDGADVKVRNLVSSFSDKRIKYFEFENSHGGASFARNFGLKNAQGEYIFFHDHDDFLYSSGDSKLILENMYNETENCDILCFKYVYHNNKIIDNIVFDKNKLRDCFLGYYYPIWNKLFKREFLLKNNLFLKDDLKVIDDCEFFIRYILAADNIKFSENCYYVYSYNKTSVLNSGRFEFFKDFKVIEYIKNTLLEYNLYDKYRLDFLNGILKIFYELNLRDEIMKSYRPIEIKTYLRKYLDLFEISEDDFKYIIDVNIKDLLFYL